jgi:hypothetical protein
MPMTEKSWLDYRLSCALLLDAMEALIRHDVAADKRSRLDHCVELQKAIYATMNTRGALRLPPPGAVDHALWKVRAVCDAAKDKTALISLPDAIRSLEAALEPLQPY